MNRIRSVVHTVKINLTRNRQSRKSPAPAPSDSFSDSSNPPSLSVPIMPSTLFQIPEYNTLYMHLKCDGHGIVSGSFPFARDSSAHISNRTGPTSIFRIGMVLPPMVICFSPGGGCCSAGIHGPVVSYSMSASLPIGNCGFGWLVPLRDARRRAFQLQE